MAAALVLAGLLAGLLAVEGALRALVPLAGGRATFIPDAVVGFRPWPGRGEINSTGFRGPELRKDGGGRRVLAVGDSVTYGLGVRQEEAYPRVLEELLPGLQVVNAGVGAWAPVQYRLFLEKRGLALEPDLVIVGLFVGNDITAMDEAWVRNTTAEGGWIISDKEAYERSSRRSRALRWLRGVLLDKSHAVRVLDDLNRRGRPGSTAFKPWFLEQQRAAARVYRRRDDEDARAAWENTFGELARIRDQCRRSGARLLVVILPDHTQVNPRLRAALALPAGEFDLLAPQRRLLRFCRVRGIECLDVLPSFLEASGTDAFLRNDSHLAPRGHRLIARAVKARIGRGP